MKQVHFTREEGVLLLLLAASADPAILNDDAARALHYKCRSLCTIIPGKRGTKDYELDETRITFEGVHYDPH